MLEAAGFAGRHHNNWSTLHHQHSCSGASSSAATSDPWGDSMPGYTPLHWHNSSRWREKANTSDIIWQESQYADAPWTTPGFPWDKYSIMDDRNIPWQLPPAPSCRSPSQEANLMLPLSTSKPSAKISDLSVTLDANHLVLHSSKYRPLRESPTPPKAKKKCTKNANQINETLFSNNADSLSVRDMNEINFSPKSSSQLEPRPSNHSVSQSVNQRSSSSSVSQSASGSKACDGVVLQPSASDGGAVSSGSMTGCAATVTRPGATAGSIDRAAFERYYEGSLLGDHCSPSTARPPRPPEEQGMCGGLGPLSLALALPGKLEGLLKLLAQSLHLVLAGFCSRKARRKERESPAAEQEHKLYLEEAVLERKIPETDLRQLVELPPGLGYHEWLASHTIDFFQHINLVYGTIAEFCTMSGCSDMSGPATRPYLWFDEKGKKVRVAAPQYIDYVMTFTQKTINDETIFPTKFENDFPVSFESIVKKIHRLLFHVIAHLYHSHFRELVLLSLHAHLNCIFAHFTLFNERFRLIDEKETEILHDLVLALRLHPEDRESRPEQEGDGEAVGAAAAALEAVRHCSTEGGSGRASPAVACTPGTQAAADDPQAALTRLDDPLASYVASPTHTDGVAPFISPELTDTRP